MLSASIITGETADKPVLEPQTSQAPLHRHQGTVSVELRFADWHFSPSCGFSVAISAPPRGAEPSTRAVADLLIRYWGNCDISDNSDNSSPPDLGATLWSLLSLLAQQCPSSLDRLGAAPNARLPRLKRPPKAPQASPRSVPREWPRWSQSSSALPLVSGKILQALADQRPSKPLVVLALLCMML